MSEHNFVHSPLCSGNGIAPNPGCSCGLVEWLYREVDRSVASSSGASEMAVFDRSEFEELLREVVALREWKATHEAAAFASSGVSVPTDRLAVVLKVLADGIATAMREGRTVDNDLRYGLVWEAIVGNGWETTIRADYEARAVSGLAPGAAQEDLERTPGEIIREELNRG